MKQYFLISSIAWLIAIASSCTSAVAMLAMGHSLSGIPGLVWILVFCLAAIRLQASSWRNIKREHFLLPICNGALFGVLLFVASNIWGLGWDGQGRHQNVVTYLNLGIPHANKDKTIDYFGDDGIPYIYHYEYDTILADSIYKDLKSKRNEIVQQYREKHGSNFEALMFYRTLGLLEDYEVISIGQVIYASISGLTGNLESAKAYNLLLIIIALLVFSLAMMSIGLSNKQSILLSSIAALNPITDIQAFTFSLDSQVASLSTILIGWGILVCVENKRLYWLGLLTTAFLLAATKMNGAVYAVAILGLALTWTLLRSSAFKQIGRKKSAIALGLTFCVLGIAIYLVLSPRLIRYNEQGELDLSWAKERVSHYLNFDAVKLPELKDRSPIEKMFISLSNQTAHGSVLQPKIPYSLHLREIKMYTKLYEGPELGGWGPFFSGCIISAIIALGFILRKHNTHKAFIIWITAVVLVISLFIPSGYVARLNPIFWMVPVLVASLGYLTLRSGITRWAQHALVVSLALNTGFILVCYSWGQAHVQPLYREQLDEIARLDQPIEIAFHQNHSVERRFHAKGIAFKPIELMPKDEPSIQLLRTPPSKGINIRFNRSDPNAESVYKNLLAKQEKLYARQIPLPLLHGPDPEFNAKRNK